MIDPNDLKFRDVKFRRHETHLEIESGPIVQPQIVRLQRTNCGWPTRAFRPAPSTTSDRINYKQQPDRTQVNAWIRTSGHFDVVVDFDKTADSAHPRRSRNATRYRCCKTLALSH